MPVMVAACVPTSGPIVATGMAGQVDNPLHQEQLIPRDRWPSGLRCAPGDRATVTSDDGILSENPMKCANFRR